MFAQSAAHALTFVRQRLSAFLKELLNYVVKKDGASAREPHFSLPFILLVHALLVIPADALMEEVEVFGNVFVVGAGGMEGMGVVVEQDVEGLGVGTEFYTLQV